MDSYEHDLIDIAIIAVTIGVATFFLINIVKWVFT